MASFILNQAFRCRWHRWHGGCQSRLGQLKDVLALDVEILAYFYQLFQQDFIFQVDFPLSAYKFMVLRVYFSGELITGASLENSIRIYSCLAPSLPNRSQIKGGNYRQNHWNG